MLDDTYLVKCYKNAVGEAHCVPQAQMAGAGQQEPYRQRLRLQALGQSHSARGVCPGDQQHVLRLERIHQGVEGFDEERQRSRCQFVGQCALDPLESGCPLRPGARVLRGVGVV